MLHKYVSAATNAIIGLHTESVCGLIRCNGGLVVALAFYGGCMDAQKGAFFVIEGTDGSGKATQFGLLKKRLEQAGYSVATFDFPQYDKPSSHFVRRYLNGDYGSAEKVGPYAGSLFYALDRYETALAMRDAINKGYIVLANRFTGSNMAHQGAKFANPSERRGYYIWLDSLEFMVLGIPRPDINFVLRVPAKVARVLAEKRAELKNPGKPLDIHEADFAQIETTVRVYDELCQLFPKDFKQIDCVRNSALMSVEQIQQMLWESLQPYLPPVPTEKLVALSVPPVTEELPSSKVVEHDKTKLARVSSLTANTLGLPFQQYTSSKTKAKPYYIPSSLKGVLRDRYIEATDSLFELYAEIQHRMPLEHASLALSVLPTSVLRSFDMPESSSIAVAALDSPEARVIRAALQIKEQKGPSAFTRANTIARMASDVLPTTYAKPSNDELRLICAVPRNELDIVPNILYPSSELPLVEIQQVTSEWQYEQKSTILLAYLATGTDDSKALASITYNWDCIIPFEVIHEIQTIAKGSTLSWQTLTPRLGYDVPEEIEEAGLLDLYERSFETSLELYSELQAAGLYQEAQYAVLQGHYVRCTFQVNGWTFRNILNNKEQLLPQTVQVIEHLRQRAAQAHPLLFQEQ